MTESVSPTPLLQITGTPIAMISPCLVGDEAFLEKTGFIKNTEQLLIEI
jgi:hypothetical protein